MSSRFAPFFSKLLRKLAMALLVAAFAWLAGGLWLFSRDKVEYAAHHASLVARLEADQDRVTGELAEARQREAALTTAWTEQQKRAVLIDKNLATQHELDAGIWDRVFGDASELKAHEELISRLDALKVEAAAKLIEVQKNLAQAGTDKADREHQLATLNEEKLTLAHETHPAPHYLRQAWQRGHVAIYVVFFAYLFGGFVVAFVLYYGWARVVVRGRPLRLASTAGLAPTVTESAVSIESAVWPGEMLCVRKQFVPSDIEGLNRHTRLLFRWSAPLASLFSGLTNLVELRNVRSVGERRVVFANAQNPYTELTLISLPEGGSLVLRPSFLIGVITSVQSPLVIRAHWCFFHWQSWVTGQFRFFEAAGPCRLVVSGVRALQAERLLPQDEAFEDSRQTQQSEVVAFTPGLVCHPARSRGFWRYARGRADLFDAKVSGTGVFLTRQHLERHGNGVRCALRKLFGL